MFYKYEINYKDGKEILYLYLSMKYEFSREFFMENEKDLERRTKNFIFSNSIPFHGEKVYLVVDGIIVKSLNISNINSSVFTNEKYSLDNFSLSIRLEDNSMCEVILRDYLISIFLNIYQKNIPDEVYKAIGVLYNTYAYKCMKEDGFLSNSSFSFYRPLSYYQNTLKDFDSILSHFNSFISEINCLFLDYKNNFILPFIHYSNEGMTLSNPKYPYLSSVKSLWDIASPYYVNIQNISYQKINKKLGISLNQNSHIEMIKKDGEKKIIIENKTYSIEEFKDIFQLSSTNIYLILYSKYVKIITKGLGNSYGLSIFGASEMAKDGLKYYQILKYYFPKTKLMRYIKELS